MNGLVWLLQNHDRDLEWMCEFYNKVRGSQIYAMTFFTTISADTMKMLWTRAKEISAERKAREEAEKKYEEEHPQDL